MAGIVERLRKGIEWTGPTQDDTGQTENLMDEAADEITRLRVEVETLRAARDLALEEAAKVCEQVSTDVWTELGGIDAKGWMKATAKDCASAIRALKSGNDS